MIRLPPRSPLFPYTSLFRSDPRALHDFVVWRQAMRSVTDFGAWEDVTRNLKGRDGEARPVTVAAITASGFRVAATDRKSTRLNSSHANISYAVFCLKKNIKCPPLNVCGNRPLNSCPHSTSPNRSFTSPMSSLRLLIPFPSLVFSLDPTIDLHRLCGV